jgi:tRNA pseudouridine13 synthase
LKIKQQPEDFQVEEQTGVVPGRGDFAFYRLEKTGWTTPDAVQAIRRRWQIDRRRVSYGGLKDRHARTIQYLTIYRGPERNLTHQRLTLTYLGKVTEPYTSNFIEANGFRVNLRALTEPQAAAAVAALAEVGQEGVANYFDDQRFGSVSPMGEFMAQALVAGRYEEALRRALAAPYEHDRAAQKKEKTILLSCWGDWARCREELPRGHARSLVDYLVHHPADFRGAVARLRPDLRGLYLSAYQSHLWNRMLAQWLRQHLDPSQLLLIRLRLGEVPMYRGLTQPQRTELASLRLPLPSARMDLDSADPRKSLLDDVLREEGLQPEQFKLKGFREMFFSRGERAALCLPKDVGVETGTDELNTGKHKLTIVCDLPRGAYMTLLVKRITTTFQKREPLSKTPRMKDHRG